MEQEENARRKIPPQVPVLPLMNTVLIEKLFPISKTEKDLKSKSPDLILSKEQLSKYIKEKLDATGDILTVWEEHPYQGIVIALSPDVEQNYDIRVGDKIAYSPSENNNMLFVHSKKKYYGIRPHEIVCRYLTKEV